MKDNVTNLESTMKFVDNGKYRIEFYECPLCFALTFSKDKLLLHVEKAHDVETIY